MKKKMAALLTSVMITVSLLVGCGSSDGPTAVLENPGTDMAAAPAENTPSEAVTQTAAEAETETAQSIAVENTAEAKQAILVVSFGTSVLYH